MTTVIFGAGASVPFFNPTLNTKYLTDQVLDRSNWERVIAELRTKRSSTCDMVTVDDVMLILYLIMQQHPNYTFEQICEMLDKFCSYNHDTRQTTYFSSLIYLFASLKECMPIHPCYVWSDVPFLYRQILAEAILDLEVNHKVPEYQVLIQRQTEFLRYLIDTDKEGAVNLASFNYDECLISSAETIGFETGFDQPADEGDGSSLDVKSFFSKKKVIYFPHGHIRYLMRGDEEMHYHSNAKVANTLRYEGVYSTDNDSILTSLPAPFAYNFNTFITSGQAKDDSLNTSPYAYFYQRMAIDILNSNRLIIIGNSLGDEHINRLLHSFRKIDESNKLYVVDYHPTPINLTQMPDETDIVFRLHRVFHTTWHIGYNPNSSTTYLFADQEQNMQRINSPLVGYGELFPQVDIYVKGYGGFLKEYQKFIY